MRIEIREARPSDASQIHEMIKELCVFQETPSSEVKTSAQDLINDGLQNNESFKGLVAEVSPEPSSNGGTDQSKDKVLVAYALYFFGYSTWRGKLLYLEDIYVKQEYRGNGIGKSLFKKLGQIVLEEKCCRMAFLCFDRNIAAKEFYAKIGAEEQPQWRMYYFEDEGVQRFLSQ